MEELIARLLLLFNQSFVEDEKIFRSIHVFDAFSMEVLLKTHHLPALVISPVSERHEQGPFANTAREVFNIRLRIVAKSASPYAYKLKPISGETRATTIYDMTSKIRDLLYQNKRLVDSTFEMRPMFNCTDIPVIWGKSSGQYDARDIVIEYTNLELYTGMQNNQVSLDPGDMFKF